MRGEEGEGGMRQMEYVLLTTTLGTRTIKIHADKDALALEVDLAGQAFEGFLSCVLCV